MASIQVFRSGFVEKYSNAANAYCPSHRVNVVVIDVSEVLIVISVINKIIHFFRDSQKLEMELNHSNLVVNQSTSSYSPQLFPSFLFSLVINSCVSTLLGIMGMIANVINMAVFIKQGLNSSINISFFTIAMSDMLRIVCIQWANICFNPYIDNAGAPIYFTDLYGITGALTSGFGCRVTLWVIVYITAERCLCILFPLTIKNIITTTRSRIIIVMITFFNSLTLIPEYSTMYLTWKYNKDRNMTFLGVAFNSNRAQTQGLSFLMHVILVVIGLCCVIVLTSILVLHLRRQTKWRMKNSAESKQRSSVSSRDRKSE
uniref:G-protein coupled receptors family 1 profile domain-containing protein n=1 Tax=Biomphalaria glabrata TaxID=6526 RepID=A0A2C9KU95_BIOGL